jgi:hypothetical protein
LYAEKSSTQSRGCNAIPDARTSIPDTRQRKPRWLDTSNLPGIKQVPLQGTPSQVVAKRPQQRNSLKYGDVLRIVNELRFDMY